MSWARGSSRGLLSNQVAQQIELQIQREGLKPGDKLGTGRALATIKTMAAGTRRDVAGLHRHRPLVGSARLGKAAGALQHRCTKRVGLRQPAALAGREEHHRLVRER